MTYLLISLPFLAVASLVWLARRRSARRQVTVTLAAGAVLLVLTAVFDNLMIWAGLVGYGSTEQLGWQVGQVPVEDFFYPVFAILMVTALWPHRGGRR